MAQLIGPLLLPGFTGATSVFGIALTTGTGALTLAGSLVNLAAGVALQSALQSAFAPDFPDLGPENINLNGAQDTAPRLRCYGENRLGYARVFFDVNDGVLGRIIVHGHGEWDSITEYYIDGSLVEVGAEGFVTTEKYVKGSKNYLRLISRLGEVQSQYYEELAASFGYVDESHRLDGLCTTALLAILPPVSKVQEVFPNREPTLEVVGRSSKLFDPRTGQTGYSANAALVLADFISHPDGFNRPDFLDESYVKAAAYICDQSIALKEGGVAPRFEHHGVYGLNEERKTVLDRIAMSFAADVFFLPDGKIGFEAGSWYEPDVTIGEDIVLSLEYNEGVDAVSGFNRLSCKYRDPQQNFAKVDAQIWEDTARIAAEGESRQEISIGGHTHMQARAVQKIIMDRENPQSTLKLICKPAAIEAFFETRLRVTLPSYAIDGVYRVVNKSIDARTLAISFELSEITQEAYSLSLDEQGEKPIYTSTDGESVIATVEGFAAGPQGVQTAQNSFTAGIGASWSAASNDSLTPVIEISVAGEDSFEARTLSSDATNAQFSGLTDGGLYDVRIAYLTAGGALSDYVLEEEVTASADTTPPNSPTGMTASDQMLGSAGIAFTTSDSASLWKTEVYRGTILIATFFDEPNTEISFTDSPGAGSYTYSARSINVSNVANDTDATDTVTVT